MGGWEWGDGIIREDGTNTIDLSALIHPEALPEGQGYSGVSTEVLC